MKYKGVLLGFAALMAERLDEKDYKPGWIGDHPVSLLRDMCRSYERLCEYINVAVESIEAGVTHEEFYARLRDDKALAISITMKAVDVANYAMMIAANVVRCDVDDDIRSDSDDE